jgi:hypothetical protein
MAMGPGIIVATIHGRAVPLGGAGVVVFVIIVIIALVALTRRKS